MRRTATWIGVGALVLGTTVTACSKSGVEELVHHAPGGDGDPGATADSTPGVPAGPPVGPPAGTPHAGPGAPDPGPPPALPTLAGWEFYGRQHGGPVRALGATMDEGGNLWVAGGDEGLFLMTPGAGRFRRFTAAEGLTPYVDPTQGPRTQKVLSVAGGPAGTVWVGYEGVTQGHDDADPPYMVKSGDADRVVLTATGISVKHVDISSPPDVHYPAGREKMRNILRIVYNPATRDVWFGGDHGVALVSGKNGGVFEHQHVAINGYPTETSEATLMSGDWYGIGVDGQSNLWMGGGHRLAKLMSGANSNYWGPMFPSDKGIDVWPDAKDSYARPSERVDDYVQDLAVVSERSVWVGSMYKSNGVPNGLAFVSVAEDGTVNRTFVSSGMVNPQITSLELDPTDGSLWVGHPYFGMTRVRGGGSVTALDDHVLGPDLVDGRVPDIQTFREPGGGRKILVAFERGAVGIYSGL